MDKIAGAILTLIALFILIGAIFNPFDKTVFVSPPAGAQEFAFTVYGESATTYITFPDNQGTRRFPSTSVVWIYDRSNSDSEIAEIQLAPTGTERYVRFHLRISKNPKK